MDPSLFRSEYTTAVNFPVMPAGAATQVQLDAYPTNLVGSRPTLMSFDQIRATVFPQPYYGPTSVDNYGNETPEIRRAYNRLLAEEPAIRSAIEGRCASVACLDVSVIPGDEDNDEDNEAAEFLQWTIEETAHGWPGLIRDTYCPALVQGYSVGEIVLDGYRDRKFGVGWGLKHVKSKDTEYIRLVLDVYRNVIGVTNTVRGLETYTPNKVILFTQSEMYSNPFGRSAIRAAYRAAMLIEAAYELWHIALQMWSMPFLVGTYKTNRVGFEKIIEDARSGGWALIPEGDKLEVLNLASASSYQAFEAQVRILREEIYMAIRGAYLPFLQGGQSDQGDTKSHKVASDALEYYDAQALGRAFSKQLGPILVRPNYPTARMPKIILGGVNWAETKDQMTVAQQMRDLKMPLSKKHLFKVSQFPPPVDDEDTITPEEPPQQPGMGGPGGGPQPPNPVAPQPTDQVAADTQMSADAGDLEGIDGDAHFAAKMDEQTFASRSHLIRKKVMTKTGKMVYRWVKPSGSQPAATPTGAAAPAGGPAVAPAPTPSTPSTPPPTAPAATPVPGTPTIGPPGAPQPGPLGFGGTKATPAWSDSVAAMQKLAMGQALTDAEMQSLAANIQGMAVGHLRSVRHVLGVSQNSVRATFVANIVAAAQKLQAANQAAGGQAAPPAPPPTPPTPTPAPVPPPPAPVAPPVPPPAATGPTPVDSRTDATAFHAAHDAMINDTINTPADWTKFDNDLAKVHGADLDVMLRATGFSPMPYAHKTDQEKRDDIAIMWKPRGQAAPPAPPPTPSLGSRILGGLGSLLGMSPPPAAPAPVAPPASTIPDTPTHKLTMQAAYADSKKAADKVAAGGSLTLTERHTLAADAHQIWGDDLQAIHAALGLPASSRGNTLADQGNMRDDIQNMMFPPAPVSPPTVPPVPVPAVPPPAQSAAPPLTAPTSTPNPTASAHAAVAGVMGGTALDPAGLSQFVADLMAMNGPNLKALAQIIGSSVHGPLPRVRRNIVNAMNVKQIIAGGVNAPRAPLPSAAAATPAAGGPANAPPPVAAPSAPKLKHLPWAPPPGPPVPVMNVTSDPRVAMLDLVKKTISNYQGTSNGDAMTVVRNKDYNGLRQYLQGQGLIDYTVDTEHVKRAVKNLATEQATTPIPPLFVYPGKNPTRMPNALLPDDTRPKLSPDERTAAMKYTGSAFKPVNDSLRATGNPPPEFAKMHQDLQSAFAKATELKAPIDVSRGMTIDPSQLQGFLAQFHGGLAGNKAVPLPGYTSTSVGAIDPHFAGNVEMRIRATHGLDMKPHTHYPHASEFLLNHNSQFHVRNVKQVGGRWVIELDQVPPSQTQPVAAGGTAAGATPKPAKPRAKATPAATKFVKKFNGAATHDHLLSSPAVKAFVSTPAGQQPTLHSNSALHGKSDDLLTGILKDSGRAEKPAQVLDQAGMDALEAAGTHKIGYRGVGDPKFNDATRYGDLRNGTGIFGNGTYIDVTSDKSRGAHAASHSSAKSYHPHVTRYAIPTKGFRTTSTGYIRRTLRPKVEKELKDAYTSGGIDDHTYRSLQNVIADDGRLAALMNFDGINASTRGYFVLLNRAKIAMQDKDV